MEKTKICHFPLFYVLGGGTTVVRLVLAKPK